MLLHAFRLRHGTAFGTHRSVAFICDFSLSVPLRWQSTVGAARHSPPGGQPKIPSILFFGGDCASVVVLQALHQRLHRIHTAAAAAAKGPGEEKAKGPGEEKAKGPGAAEKSLFVVCPFLPLGPRALAQRHRRQYPVARYCAAHGIPLLPVDHPTSLARSGTLRDLMEPSRRADKEGKKKGDVEEEEEENIAAPPLDTFDVAVVVSFRYFLPNALLERMPPTVNMHPSLLPKYRGASPIFAPLLRGDEVGGASVIKLTPRTLMDAGDVLWQQSFPIARDLRISEYFPLVTQLGAAGLCHCIFGGPPPPASLTDCNLDSSANMIADLTNSAECDWPRTFESRWAGAWTQGHKVHFKKDQFHAPLFPKDRAIIKWSIVTAGEAYGTWRAFVGGEFFSPTVNATLDKGATPIRDQLLKRLQERAARRSKNVLAHPRAPCESMSCIESSNGFAESMEAVSDRKSVVGDDISSSASLVGLEEEQKKQQFRVHLLIGCTFTNAVHPKDIPANALCELQNLEVRYTVSNENAARGPSEFIEPGSAYFPKSAEEICAVKCREGWFVWSSAALQGSTSQPASLLRKGMAMKTGVLYTNLFVHNSKKEDGALH